MLFTQKIILSIAIQGKRAERNEVETIILLFALASLKARNAELEKRIKGFERLAGNFADEIDRRAGEFASPKRNNFQDSNSFLKAA
jgi:hypothetical protein